MAMLNQTIAARVRQERMARGWSQLRLLREAEFPCGTSTMSLLELGKRTWDANVIEAMALAFGISAAELVTPKAESPPAAEEAA